MLQAQQNWKMRGEIWKDNILMVCKEYGWSLDYVLNMPLKAYFQSFGFLEKYYKEMTNGSSDQNSESITFR